ncbi:MAG: ion transporter [Bacteroidetes bacterium]|nr:ion transporter [Bacteroidota bacterium]
MKNKEKIKRYRLLVEISGKTEIPLIILGFLWLLFLIIELVWHLNSFLQTVATVIWGIFIIDFLLKLFLAPSKWLFLKKNILTIISLFIPALRVFRIFAGLRLLKSLGFIRSIRIVRIIGSINRGMRALGRTLERKAFGYVILLTLIICFVGAAAMYAFEKETGAFNSYGDALWWTAMLITTIASEYWPKTPEGKVICFLLSLYSLAILGYLTATLASFFIGQDASNKKGEIAGAKQFDKLMQEIKHLREELKSVKEKKGND